ncbi:MAG: TonB-dependent receptor [Acidobacteria bacterium]|nr:TonB-dependent receptor [Acidobacteriota bacterium]
MKGLGLLARVVMCVFFLSGVVFAQVTTGTVSGTVSDSTGAVIPGATVTLRNTETGITRTLSTNAQGRYNAQQLSLGMFEVSAEAPGFQSVVRSGIEMTVGRQAVVDFTLQVGAVSERITVTGEAPLLETTNATVADLVTERQMRELPLNGRSFTDLTAIQPGVVTDLDIPAGVFQGGGRAVVNGARPQQSLYLLDGTDIVSPYSNVAPVSVMNQTLGVDTIREFTVIQNNYGAQYGRAIGGVINAVTRSGTNEIHGSAFEFLRNEKLDAKNFFDLPSCNGRENTLTFVCGPIPPYKRNQFGGTIGGPVVKDNAFFFFSYEGLRQSFGTTDFGSAYTDEARAGQITNCPFQPGSTTIRLRTCTKEQAIITETLLKGIHPDIKPIVLGLIPRANGLYLNDGSQELRGSRTQPGRENYYMFRIDQRLSDNDSIFGRMVMDTSSKELPDAQFIGDGKTHSSTNDWGSYRFLTVEWARIVSPAVLNIARFGFARNNNQQCMCIDGEETKRTNVEDAAAGIIPSQMTVIPGQPWGDLSAQGTDLPGGHNGPGASAGPGADLDDPLKFIDNTFSYFDSVRVSKGRHSWDFGLDVRRFQENELASVWAHGVVGWYSPLKNFLTAGKRSTGYCSGGSASSTGSSNQCRGISSITTTGVTGPPDVYRGWRQTYAAWYVQDDFQLLPNLTFNLGVRWEKITPPVEVNGKAATFADVLRDTGYTQLGKEPLFTIRNILGGLTPRFGFAYSPDQNTSIRGGFGMFKEMPLEYLFQLAIFYPPYAERLNLRDLGEKWPNPLAGADPTRGTREPLLVNPDFKYPYGMQWNFSIQRQFGLGWLASASYIGTAGRDLVAVINHIQPPQSIDANGVPYTKRGEPNTNPFLSSTRTYANLGDSSYNALQLRLEKRFSQGLNFSSSHTWSKNITNVGIGLKGAEGGSFGGGFTIGNIWNYKNDSRGRADQDTPHNFTFNAGYDIPVGQGKHFGTNMGNIANAILGGWQINGVFTKRAGLPKDIGGAGYSTSQYCRCSIRPNLKPGGNNNPVIGDLDHWFDETQFLPVAAGYYGNVGKNTLTGPGLTKVDFSVFKRFAVGEGRNLQFRTEFFNLPNHANFAAPGASVFDTDGQYVANPGRVTRTVGTSRQVQLALKFEF